MRQHLVRLDRVASAMNAWLLAIAIGLGLLDATVMVAKCMPSLPPLSAAASSQTGPATAPSPPARPAGSGG